MKTYYECIPCFVNQTLKALSGVDSSLHESIYREVLRELADIDFSQSPPQMARKIFDVIEKYTDGVDLYAEEKLKSNTYILQLYNELKETIVSSEDPFKTALKLAIAGNIIDFGAKHDFSDELIHDQIEEVLSVPVAEAEIEKLRDAVDSAEQILYLGDNAGEIVFDRLFIEQLPVEKITFAVRGKPVINDALMEDAGIAGITDIVPVISNGSGIPGTVLEDCSGEFRKVLIRLILLSQRDRATTKLSVKQINQYFFY